MSLYEVYAEALRAECPIVLATVVSGEHIGAKLLVQPDQDSVGDLGDSDLNRVVERDAIAGLETGLTELRHYGLHGEARMEEVSIFIEVQAPRPQLLIFGAVDFTRALGVAAKFLGFRVTVCDAREVFATERRFPMVDEVVVDWPHRLLERVGHELGPRDAVCVLTHDNKFDVPAIIAALGTDVGYIGAMGSRNTHAKRSARLLEEGVTQEQLDSIMAPIGLDIGGRTPEETALAICAEIIALRTGRTAPSLSSGDGPIHT